MATTGRVRRLVVGMAAGLTIALAVLGTGAQDASAQPVRVKEQREFVKTCRELGGSSQSTGPRTVQCTYQNGAQMECNFNTNECTSHLRTASGGGKPVGGSQTVGAVVEPVVADDADGAAGHGANGDDSEEAMSPLE